MAKLAPNTILLAGGEFAIRVGDIPAGEAITPGHIVKMYASSGANRWKKNDSATDICDRVVALDQPELNKTVDDAYAANDLVKVAFLYPGCVIWALISSGQNIANGDYLQSNGDGTLKKATATTASANVAVFQSLDNPGAVTVSTRLRVQVVR